MLHLTSCECLGPAENADNKKAQSREALGEVAETGVYGRGTRPRSEHAKQDQDQHDN
jgi:hypothetical protein